MTIFATRATLLSTALTATSRPWLTGTFTETGRPGAGDTINIVDSAPNFLAQLASAPFLANLAALRSAIGEGGTINITLVPGMPAATAAGVRQPVTYDDALSLVEGAPGTPVVLNALQFRTLANALDTDALRNVGLSFSDQRLTLADTATAINTAFGAASSASGLAEAVRVLSTEMRVSGADEAGLVFSANPEPIKVVVMQALAAVTGPTADAAGTPAFFDNLVGELSVTEALTGLTVNVDRGLNATSAVFNALTSTQMANFAATYSSFSLSDATGGIVDVPAALRGMEAGLLFAGSPQTTAVLPPVGLRVAVTVSGTTGTVTSAVEDILTAAAYLNPTLMAQHDSDRSTGVNSVQRVPVLFGTLPAVAGAPLTAATTLTAITLDAGRAEAIASGGLVLPAAIAVTADYSASTLSDTFGSLGETDSGLERTGQGTTFEQLAAARIDVLKVENGLEITVREAERLVSAGIKALDSEAASATSDRDLVIRYADVNGDGVVSLGGQGGDGNNFAGNTLSIGEIARLAARQADVATGATAGDATDIWLQADEGDVFAMSLSDMRAMLKSALGGATAVPVARFVHIDADVVRISMTAADFTSLSAAQIGQIMGAVETGTRVEFNLVTSTRNDTPPSKLATTASALVAMATNNIRIVDADGGPILASVSVLRMDVSGVTTGSALATRLLDTFADADTRGYFAGLTLQARGSAPASVPAPVPGTQVDSASIALSADTGISASDGVTNVAAQTVSASLTADLSLAERLQVSFDGGTTFVDVTDSVSGRTVTLAGITLVEGVNAIVFRVDNVYGGRGTAIAVQATLDTSAPAAPELALAADTGTDAADAITSDGALNVSAVQEGTTRTFSINGGEATSTYTAPTADGTYTVTVTDSDAAGNGASQSITFTLDTTGPAAASLALAVDSGTDGDLLTSDGEIVFGALEEGASRVITVDGAEVAEYDPTALEDGEHVVVVTDTDVAGNSTSQSITFTLDTTGPAAASLALAVDSGTDGDLLTNDGEIVFGALEEGATRVITVDGVEVAEYDPTTLDEGEHVVTVTDTDAAGNVGETASFTFTLDTTGPAEPSLSLAFDSGPDAEDLVTSDGELLFSDLEEGISRVITVDGVEVAEYDPTVLEDGEHVVTVTDSDAAGNAASRSVTFVLDTTGPAAPSLALSSDTGTDGDRLTNDGALVFGDLEAGATRVITVNGVEVAEYDPTNLEDGEYTVVVTDTDAAGNVGEAASLVFNLDTVAPGAPLIALAFDSGADGADLVTNDATLFFSDVEDGSTRVITVDGVEVAEYDPSALEDGEHVVVVTDTDFAGNSASQSITFTLDATAPAAPTLALAVDSGTAADLLSNDGDVVIGTLEEGASRVITVDGVEVAEYDPTILGDGEHVVTVTDTDAVGNVGETASLTFTLDATAPAAPTIALAVDSGVEDDFLTNDGALVFGDLEEGGTRVITVDGLAVASYDPTSLEDGEHVVTVTDTDGAGNVGETASLTFTLDTTAPATSLSLATDSGTAADLLTNDAEIVFGALEDGASRVITVDGVEVAEYDPTILEDGQHVVTVADTDQAGNTGSRSLTFTLDTTAPTFVAVAGGFTVSEALSAVTMVVDGTTLTDAELAERFDVTGPVDGVFSFAVKEGAFVGTEVISVTATDVAGNVSEPRVLDARFTGDTTPPELSLSLAEDSGSDTTDGITNNAAITVSDLEAGATRVIKVDGSTVASYDPTVLEDGEHTVEVTDTDLAGNSTTRSVTFTLDTAAPGTAPTLVVDSGTDAADGLTNDARIDFGTLEAGATRIIEVDGSVVAEYDAASLVDGDHFVTVTETDLAGNTEARTLAFTLDTGAPAAPDAPTIENVADPDNPEFTIGFRVPQGSNVTVAINDVDVTGAGLAAYFTTASASGITTYTAIAGAFDGTEGVVVSATLDATDDAGNTATSLAAGPIALNFIDTTAPDASGVLAAVADPDNAAFAMGFTAPEGSELTVTIGGFAVPAGELANFFTSDTADGVTTYTALGDVFDGETVTVSASIFDTAGNTATAELSLVIDTTAPTSGTPPTIEAVADADDATYASGFRVTADANVTVTIDELAVTGNDLATYFSIETASGITTYTAVADAFDGSEVVSVSATLAATDAAGNIGPDSEATTLALDPIDTSAPVVADIVDPDMYGGTPDSFGFSAGFKVLASDLVGGTLSVTVGSSPENIVTLSGADIATMFTVGTEDENGFVSYTAKDGLFVGNEVVSISLKDAAGNVTADPVGLNTVDTTAPVAPVAALVSNEITIDTGMLDASAEIYSAYYSVGGAAAIAVADGGELSFLSGDQVTFFLEDYAGNLSGGSNTITFDADTTVTVDVLGLSLYPVV